MSIYQVAENVFRFQIWNLNADRFGLAGHFTIWWDRKNDNFVLGKHGGFGGLTWYPEQESVPVIPSPAQVGFLKPIIEKNLKFAYFWSDDRKNHEGEYLMSATREREKAGEYIGLHDGIVFPADEPLKRTLEEKKADDEAVKILIRIEDG